MAVFVGFLIDTSSFLDSQNQFTELMEPNKEALGLIQTTGINVDIKGSTSKAEE
jgi:hypothetical protein